MYQHMQPLSDGGDSYLVIVTPKGWGGKHVTHLLCSHGEKKPRELRQLPKTPLQAGGKLEDLLQGSLKPASSVDQANNR